MALMTGPISAECDICGVKTGNLPKHRRACVKRANLPVHTGPLTEEEKGLIDRAGSHAVAETALDYDRQLHHGVTDLDVAVLLLFLDRGGEIIPGLKRDTWRAPAGSPLKGENGVYPRRSLSRVVNEAIRLGLVFVASEQVFPDVWHTYLAPSLTHMRSRFNPLAPACSRPINSIKRYRLLDHDHLALVDCQACVDIAAIE